MRFDRSWLPGILAFVGVIVLRREVLRTPPAVQLALAALMGGWLLWTAWGIWRTPTRGAEFGAGGKRVQYWRGQRIELEPARPARRSAPPNTQLAIAAFYALTGALVLAVVAISAADRLA
ncbi:MAG TPA: hypothetical protein VD886_13595 [Herpetosiphonaceae bacterium]|nr:hypothetical protein [Herpetosiphonaceae bacterium]